MAREQLSFHFHSTYASLINRQFSLERLTERKKFVKFGWTKWDNCVKIGWADQNSFVKFHLTERNNFVEFS